MAVLDTSFLISLQEGDEAAEALLRELSEELLVVPPWVVVEYLTGHTARPERLLEELDRAFTLVQTTPQWAVDAARMRRSLRGKGIKIRLPDFWIASLAAGLRPPVVTRNVRHFESMGVATRTW